MTIRPIESITKAVPTLEGAGVKLHRAFGFNEQNELDPFLLFDDFRNERPEDFIKGFPWHPHRGIETITYVLDGTISHADSLGNQGTLAAGDVQWMTAGSGIMHQEMPHANPKGQMHGFQLWANLPSDLKMTKPRYQDVGARDIPVVVDDDGTSVKIVVGEFWGKRGPVDGIAAQPRYLDVFVPPMTRRVLKVDTYRTTFAYVFSGKAHFKDSSAPQGVLLEKEVFGQEVNIRDMSGNRNLIKFGSGDEIVVVTQDEGVRFLLISGQPLEEPVAWHGPIVMNTKEELRQAVNELRNGTFIKPQH